jgi:putative ABC transport system permease protein
VSALDLITTVAVAALVLYLLYLAAFDRFNLVIAFRNVFRNIRRSTITILAIALGGAAVIVFGGFINDMYYGLRESTIRSQLGHVQLYREGYGAYGLQDPEEYRLYDYERIVDVIENDPVLRDYVTAAIPVVEFSGLVSTGETTRSFVARGVDLEKDRFLSSYDLTVDGTKLYEGDRGVVSMGYLLARSLEAVPGDLLMILTSTRSVGLNVIDVEVGGTTRSFSEEYDRVYLKMPIEDAWSLLGEEYADKLIVMIRRTRDLPIVLERLIHLNQAEALGIEYREWEDLATFYRSVKQMYDGIFAFLKVVMSIMVVVFVSNTLFMAVMERVGETGSVRTIGARRRTVVANFLTEGILMGIIGGLVGIGLAWLVALVVNHFGIPMPPPPGSSTGFTAILRYDADAIPFFGFSFKLSVLTAFVAAVIPARRAISMSVVDALRHY